MEEGKKLGLVRRLQKMGSKEVLLFFLVSFHFFYPVSLLPLGKTLASARLQEKEGEKGTVEHKSLTHYYIHVGAAGGRGGGGGRGGSGGRGGNGEEGNGGSSTTPNTGAGSAVIPLYGAGAANGHRSNHHGAASRNQSCIGLPALCAVILASLFVHIYVILGIENLARIV